MARLLHLRDLPEADLLHRLQTLCNAHQEFTHLSHKYEAVSPVPTPCNRFNAGGGGDPHLPHVRPTSSGRGGGGGSVISSGQNLRRFDDFHDDHFDDEFDFGKKY